MKRYELRYGKYGCYFRDLKNEVDLELVTVEARLNGSDEDSLWNCAYPAQNEHCKFLNQGYCMNPVPTCINREENDDE